MGPLTGQGLTRGSASGNGPLQAHPGEGLGGLWTSFLLAPSSVLAPPCHTSWFVQEARGGLRGGGRSLLRKQAGAPSQRGLLCSPRHQPLSSSRAACQVGQKPRRGSCCYNHILESGAHQCPPGAERRCRLLASPLGPRHRHADTLPAKILSLETPASSCLLPRTSGPDISLLKTGRTAVCMIILGSVLPAGEVASMFDR